ncbi:MAG TPA: phosphomannomutase/phosphoglucomutase [Candidatus Saccharimonadales bacterium]|nr:phosphomannomutase/phosphoglucomutase [Candidatus Saccharimonadales bacterium]
MDNLGEIFKSYDIRGKVGSQLNPAVVKAIARVFADWLPTEGPIVVGHDMRADSRTLADELIQGLVEQGRDVWDIGLATSDMVYFSPGKFDLAGGAMITASHNPGEYNGIKFCREKALPVGLESGLDEIRDRFLADKVSAKASTPGKAIKKEVLSDWISHVMSFIDPAKIKPFRIGIDAGNGMGGLTAPLFAAKLPIDVTPLYFELDGTFPNHEANPMKVETLSDLSTLIKNQKLDFGIAFDGDADRMALVDEKGQPVTGSMTCALLSKYVLEKYPGSTIVHDLRMSRSTVDLIHKLGGATNRTKVGNTIIKEAARKYDAAFGGEITGHFMFKDNYFVDSGLLAAAIAIEVLSEADFTLSEFVGTYDTYVHTPEINLHADDSKAALETIASTFSDGEIDWLDGLTVQYEDAWFNVRPSNTEPVMRFNIEAKTKEQLDELVTKVRGLIKQ